MKNSRLTLPSLYLFLAFFLVGCADNDKAASTDMKVDIIEANEKLAFENGRCSYEIRDEN